MIGTERLRSSGVIRDASIMSAGKNETLTGFLTAIINADVVVSGESSLYWAVMQYSGAIGVVHAPAGCTYEKCQATPAHA